MLKHPTTPHKAPVLSSFTIGSFRGLRNVTLDRLSLLNLLVGGNNSGKTSVLEAMAILSAGDDIREWLSVARMRDVRDRLVVRDSLPGLSLLDALVWLFPHDNSDEGQFSDPRKIELSLLRDQHQARLLAECEPVTQVRHLRIGSRNVSAAPSDLEEVRGWRISGFHSGLSDLYSKQNELLFDGLEKDIAFEFNFWEDGLDFGFQPRSSKLFPSIMMPPYAHRNQSAILRGYSRALKKDYKSDVLRLIRKLDGNITDIEIITQGDGRIPVMTLRHRRSGLTPLSVFGDGIRRALTIALSMPRVRNGLLLIDEIDAAMHVSALDEFFHWLAEACETMNVQLVATTHSLEAVNAMIGAVAPNGLKALSSYHLEGGEDGVRVKRFYGEMLNRVVREGGLDIR